MLHYVQKYAITSRVTTYKIMKMTTPVHSHKSSHIDTPQTEPIDLSKPDAEAAALAEKLQAVHTQITFMRAVNFIGKWIIRPIFWWPIKYYFKAIFWVAKNTKNESEDEFLFRIQQNKSR